ncbi:hypothetical protein [Taibaiella helva]|uniref:hypothetical protein n=1 Tax=Taibaiella helva TaxID=2301235 RepID=UPI000E58C1B5|nr:hypothetical protein [Taibaiella helva]
MRPFYRVLSYVVMILQSLIILVLLCRHSPARPGREADKVKAAGNNIAKTTFRWDSCWHNN